jgi:hypothetical protein
MAMRSLQSAFDQLSPQQRREELQPIAVLALSPVELDRRYGIRFEASRDDLDEFYAALLELQNGHQFALLRYSNSPSAGTELYAAESVDPAQARDEFLEAFSLRASELEWVRESDARLWVHQMARRLGYSISSLLSSMRRR